MENRDRECQTFAEFARASRVAMLPDRFAEVRGRLNAIAPGRTSPGGGRDAFFRDSALRKLAGLEKTVADLMAGEKPPIIAKKRPSEG